MYLEGIGFNRYRSVGDKPVRLGPLSQINLLIGANNSGKSNILSFLTQQMRSAREANGINSRCLNFNAFDVSLGNTQSPTLELAFKPDGNLAKVINERVSASNDYQKDRYKKFLELPTLKHNSMVWFRFKSEGMLVIDPEFIAQIQNESAFSDADWNGLLVAVKGRQENIPRNIQNTISEILMEFSLSSQRLPQIDLIPAFRKIETLEQENNRFAGQGLIIELQKLQNPTASNQSDKKKFQQIETFAKEVLGNQSVEIEIPHDRQTILVRMDNKTLPLLSLGTGVHQVIILASAATTVSKQILCIEEPELHLHPLLQRQLIRYLAEKTDNQYFITTHSAHLLDTKDAQIFHVRLVEGWTEIEHAVTDHHKTEICHKLGYRASDLLQANFIVWVEGPSDRIYLTYWISTIDPYLVEGLHYSVMFYGGKLLSHLTTEDCLEDVISLRRLNRYIAVVMDRDKANAESSINTTKQRILEELKSDASGYGWVTEGREIENYIEPSILANVLKEKYSDFSKQVNPNKFGNSLHFKKTDGTVQKNNIDKIEIARKVVLQKPDLNRFDLEQNIKNLVHAIRAANS